MATNQNIHIAVKLVTTYFTYLEHTTQQLSVMIWSRGCKVYMV